MQKNVAVLFGGISCENEISVITGVMAANLLDGDRYSVHPNRYTYRRGILYGEGAPGYVGVCGESVRKIPSRCHFGGKTV